MSSAVTNRVYLPDGNKIYLSDDAWGDKRIDELHQTYGNLKVEACHKEWGKSLDDMQAFWQGTIESFYSSDHEGDDEGEVIDTIDENNCAFLRGYKTMSKAIDAFTRIRRDWTKEEALREVALVIGSEVTGSYDWTLTYDDDGMPVREHTYKWGQIDAFEMMLDFIESILRDCGYTDSHKPTQKQGEST